MNTGRIIPFDFALQGVKSQMDAETGDAQRKLPIHACFLSVEREIPSRSGKRFAQNLFFAILTGNRCCLQHGIIDKLMVAQKIDAGNIHVLNKTHGRTAMFCLGNNTLFAEHMTGEEQTVCFTPFCRLYSKSGNQQFCPEIFQLPAHFGTTLPLHLKKQFRQML